MTNSYTAKQFVETFIFQEAKDLNLSGHTFSAFMVLSVGIEVLGHCLVGGSWGNAGGSEEAFMKAISEFHSLTKYSCYDYSIPVKEESCKNKNCKWRRIHNFFNTPTTKSKRKNHLYSGVRCGLAHRLINNNITLCQGNDDDKNNVVGFNDFYKNVYAAWIELQSPTFYKKLKKNLSEIVYYTDTTTSSSGDTPYIVSSFGTK